MNVPESADREGTPGKSAEFPAQAWSGNGVAGNTCGTVRGKSPRGRYPLTEFFHTRNTGMGKQLSVGACLYRLFVFVRI